MSSSRETPESYLGLSQNFGTEAIDVSTFDEFESVVTSIENVCDSLMDKDNRRVESILFRGHVNSRWSLESTLERFLARNGKPDSISVDAYYHMCWQARKHIAAFYPRKWEIPELEEFDAMLKRKRGSISTSDLAPFIGFWAYLRHHGFPSPLLDWSRSPYIALFFAVFNAVQNNGTASVFVYCGMPQNAKQSKKYGMILDIGPIIETHQRHFFQQSQYTLSLKVLDGRPFLGTYDVKCELDNEGFLQDLIWKVTIPLSMRSSILKRLDRMNINAFSIFGNEEGLLSKIAEDFLKK